MAAGSHASTKPPSSTCGRRAEPSSSNPVDGVCADRLATATDGGDRTEEVTPTAPSTASRYYLVVAHNSADGEGSYGNCSLGACMAGDERPVGTAVCVAPQVVTPCPP